MGQPIWQIRNSNLGTIAENIFFEFELEAIDTDLGLVSYSLIAGTLPDGIQLTGTAISGIPIKVTGVPAEVDVDTSTQFAIRATTTTNEVSDITLDLTVSGQTAPEILTPTGLLGTFFYGDYVDLQLDAIDTDVGNTLSWEVINNTLPDGLALTVDPDDDRIAYIRGYPVPASALPPGAVPGFDAQPFDEDLGEFGFDFGLETVDKSFEFVISVTDGISFDSGTFSIFLQSNLVFHTADESCAIDVVPCLAETTILRADGTLVSADHTSSSTSIDPIMLTEAQDLGTLLHDNYFTFLFEGLDFEGDQIEFLINSGTLPTSLVLDPDTGWLHGDLDIITTASESYTFAVVSRKVFEPTFISDPITFTMTVVSDLANSLIINSPTTMTIDNGEISELFIDASANAESIFDLNADADTVTADQVSPTADTDTNAGTLLIAVDYRLASGQLPIGLALTRDGLIIGRPSFTHLTWDMGTTTFDEETTTFDNTYTFDVLITDITLGVITQTQTFSIIVNPLNLVPYENLYLVSRPTIPQRALLQTMTSDTTIIPRDNIYREGDAYFGVVSDLRFLLADGLAAGTRTQYDTILENNHYTRRFSFSQLKIAKAVGDDGDPSYELIYADVIDSLENNGNSIGTELIVDGVDLDDLSNREPPAVPQFDAAGNIIIKPASLDNMRAAVIGDQLLTADNVDQDLFSADQLIPTADATVTDGLGQINLNTLPDWMTTTQDDGRIFSWIPAVPVIYCKPGEASQIMFDINQSGFNLNEISFDVDRYIWDNNLSKIPIDYFLTLGDDETSFDGIDPNGSFVGGATGGTSYGVGGTITLSNGGEITISAVDANGIVTGFTITAIGLAITSGETLYHTLTADSDTNTADSDINTADGTYTTAGGSDSTSVTADSDIITADATSFGTGFTITPFRPADTPDVNDEYLKFPKTNVFQ